MTPLWPFSVLRTLVRTYGVRGLWLRSLHEARRKTAAYSRAPRFRVDATNESPPFAFQIDPARIAGLTDCHVAVARGERVLGGEYQAYRAAWLPLPASREAWHRNPVSGHIYDASQPWWSVRLIDDSAGDIKDLWEPARFSWVYDLARAYIVTNDAKYSRAFSNHLARWVDANPPFSGPHWACGQETAIRAIALLYAETAFSHQGPAAPPDRILIDALSASGERIADGLGYGVSQRNNHAISEATGLVVLGLRFRGIHPDAAKWLTIGRSSLERAIVEQFADDGWYIQHSFNYLRLALDQSVIAQCALKSAGEKGLSERSVLRLGAACELISTIIDGDTGTVPNHGSNDGAFVHPATTADYTDYRATLTAACTCFGKGVPPDIRLDLEPLAWLSLDPPHASPPRTDGVFIGASGWACARVGSTVVFLRAGAYHSRPGHLDPLHIDVRFDSSQVVVDPGTFSYHSPAPWNNGLIFARVHNGPMLDDEEPGIRGPRFLWLKWPSARIVSAKYENGLATIVAENSSGVSRTVVVTQKRVDVTDKKLDGSAHKLRVCWLLHPLIPIEVFRSEGPFRVVAASDRDTVGWFSPCYGERLRSRALLLESEEPAMLNILSSFVAQNQPLVEADVRSVSSTGNRDAI